MRPISRTAALLLVVALSLSAGIAGQSPKANGAGGLLPHGAAPEHQKYVSAEGITIPEGAEGIPNANLGTDSLPGKTVRVSLSGKAIAALLDFSGSAQYTLDGKLARGTERMKPTQITTTKKDGAWLKVTGLGIDTDGFLLVIDESGSTYRIALGSGFRGRIEEKTK